MHLCSARYKNREVNFQFILCLAQYSMQLVGKSANIYEYHAEILQCVC